MSLNSTSNDNLLCDDRCDIEGRRNSSSINIFLIKEALDDQKTDPKSQNNAHKKPVIKTEPHIIILLKPFFELAQLFGLFPFRVQITNFSQPLREVSKLSFTYFHTLFILFLTSSYCSFHCFSLVKSVIEQRSTVTLIGQALWLQASVLSYVISINFLIKPLDLVKLYSVGWHEVEKSCGKSFSSQRLKKFVKRCFWSYGLAGLASMGLVGFHSLRIPDHPAYILHYIKPYIGREFKSTELLAHTLVQMTFILWKWLGNGLLDISLCIFGYVISETMGNLSNSLSDCLNARKEEFSDEMCRNNDFSIETCQATDDEKRSHYENEESQKLKNQTILKKCSKDENIIKMLSDFQIISDFVSQVNRAVGPLLLIDFAQLILMICALIFLPIKYYEDLDFDSTFIFSGNAVVFIGRLFLLTLCLGDVYPAGIGVNIKISHLLIKQKFSSSVFYPIMGHLSVFSTNPICFNAWGFFSITRGTLLAAFSVISTYIVVLLQVK